jgi:hypothetical protein
MRVVVQYFDVVNQDGNYVFVFRLFFSFVAFHCALFVYTVCIYVCVYIYMHLYYVIQNLDCANDK